MQFFEFTVIARDGGKVPHEGYAKVIISLIDVNDNHPVFEPAKYQVSENTPLHTMDNDFFTITQLLAKRGFSGHDSRLEQIAKIRL